MIIYLALLYPREELPATYIADSTEWGQISSYRKRYFAPQSCSTYSSFIVLSSSNMFYIFWWFYEGEICFEWWFFLLLTSMENWIILKGQILGVLWFVFDILTMFCDDSNAIHISKTLVQHSRTKHIDIILQFIPALVVKIYITHIFTQNQLAESLPMLLILRDFLLLESLLSCACCRNVTWGVTTSRETSLVVTCFLLYDLLALLAFCISCIVLSLIFILSVPFVKTLVWSLYLFEKILSYTHFGLHILCLYLFRY